MDSKSRARRHSLKLTAHEIERFLKALTETGNATLAAERIGRHRSTFVKRCARDPVFAARCGQAVAQFRLKSSSPAFAGGHASATRDRRSRWRGSSRPLKHARGDLVLVRGRKLPAQVRRAGGGELTQAGLDAFLQSLAATANIRLSADSVGVRPNAIRQRRLRDPAFDQVVRHALRIGYDRLEAALLESACRSLDPDEEQDERMERTGDPELPRMSVGEAMMLLAQHRRACREGWETKRAERNSARWEDVELYFTRQLRRLGVEVEEGG